MKFITPAEIEYFRKRYAHAPDHALTYAMQCADEYAEKHAPNALPSIKDGIAQLHFRYGMEGDVGERRLIRIAIDQLIALGSAINANAQA